ncbi:hypothetical protein L9F63_023792, partial [Diploptera punctata]
TKERRDESAHISGAFSQTPLPGGQGTANLRSVRLLEKLPSLRAFGELPLLPT